MRKIVFAINISTDGYCGHSDMAPTDESYALFTGLLRNSSVLVFGRITYQLMVPYWPDVARNPSETGPAKDFACVFDALDKIVFSTTLPCTNANNTRVLRSGLVEEVLALKALAGKDIFIDSLSLANQLSDHGLIDEYHFVVHPVIAGSGPRLFEASTSQQSVRLELIGAQTFRSGLVYLHYKRGT